MPKSRRLLPTHLEAWCRVRRIRFDTCPQSRRTLRQCAAASSAGFALVDLSKPAQRNRGRLRMVEEWRSCPRLIHSIEDTLYKIVRSKVDLLHPYFAPSAPPGWLRVNAASSRFMAEIYPATRASHRTVATVVEVVGQTPIGSPSIAR